MNFTLKSVNIDLKNSILRNYIIVFGLLYLLLALSLSIAGEFRFVIALLAPIIIILIITQPKMALYQFLFLFFTNIAVIKEPQILIIDISAFLLIGSAFIDYLLKPDVKYQRPKLLNNFVFLIIVVTIAAIFGYKPFLALRPIAKLLYLTMTFLAVHRLSRYIELKKLLTLFFWFAVFFSLVAIWPIIKGEGSARLFGFSKATLDDIMLLVIPLGIIIMMFSERRKGKWLLLGILISFVALLATQSRLSLLLTVLFSAIAIYLVRLRYKKQQVNDNNEKNYSISKNLIKRRIKIILLSLPVLLISIFVLKPTIILDLWTRFSTLLESTSWDTIQLRFVLWKSAAKAFWDHPIIGIGPGMFKELYVLYPELKFSHAYFVVQGFSAHNLILHYLAETGIVGGLAIVMLMIKQNLLGFELWKDNSGKLPQDILISLFVITLIFLVSAFFEAGWLWGQLSYMFVFFLALVVRANELKTN